MKVITYVFADHYRDGNHWKPLVYCNESSSPSEYLAVVDEVNVLFGKEHGGISPTSHRLEPRSSKESEETV
jgi:hypothetical protein